MRILLVEDNQELVSLLLRGLKRSGFSADSVATAGDAAHALATVRYAAVVLDLGLPDQDGLAWLRDVRSRGDSTPILVLTARDGVSDRVTGLRAGADDYLVKPLAMEELVARLRALLRRSNNLLGQCLTLGNVALDTEGRQVTVGGTVRPFSSRETAVLEILLRRCGNVAPKRLFEDHLFGLSDEVGSNAVEVYIHRLRRILADCGATVQVHTVRGVGYMLAEAKGP
ncbi:MAG: response regulator transcription factor [Rhodospirillales bacterium]|nr:response regulator transcription factor [Rhodospirillales bacterium]